MLEFLALITKKRYWRLHSILIKLILTKLYGVKVGKNFYIEGVPKLKIKGRAQDIIIGDNVSIFGNIDIRNRERGRINIGEGVAIDNDCRFVAANQAVLKIGKMTSIGPFCIFNCGANVTIGDNCLISGIVHIQSSQHKFNRGELIKNQGHTYGEIYIGNDVWLAFNVSILKGVILGDGCVVGAKSLVKEGRFDKDSILAGIPAVKIKERL